jgi:hypothetical protein
MLLTCISTVRGLRNSSRAISRLVRPVATIRRISTYRRVRPRCSSCAAVRLLSRRSADSPRARGELITGLLNASIKERSFAQCVRECGHRLILTDTGGDLGERSGAGPRTGGLPRLCEERRGPPQSWRRVVPLLDLLPPFQQGPAVTGCRLRGALHAVHNG